MQKHLTTLKFTALAILAVVAGTMIGSTLDAQVIITTPCTTQPCFDGNLQDGTNAPFDVPRDISLTELILRVINFILSVVLILAVLAIIIAGVYLITGMGSDSSKEKAKNIILYVVIGILIILFSRAIVLVFLNFFG